MVPRDSAARCQDRTDNQSDTTANDGGGKTKFDHRNRGGRRIDVEPHNQPNDGSDHAYRSRPKYCPPHWLCQSAQRGHEWMWRCPRCSFLLGVSVHHIPSRELAHKWYLGIPFGRAGVH